jgi:hypothetical protein
MPLGPEGRLRLVDRLEPALGAQKRLAIRPANGHCSTRPVGSASAKFGETKTIPATSTAMSASVAA